MTSSDDDGKQDDQFRGKLRENLDVTIEKSRASLEKMQRHVEEAVESFDRAASNLRRSQASDNVRDTSTSGGSYDKAAAEAVVREAVRISHEGAGLVEEAQAEPGRVKLTVNLPEREMATLRSIAARRDMSLTDVVRRAIAMEQFIEEVESQGGKLLVEQPDHSMRQLMLR